MAATIMCTAGPVAATIMCTVGAHPVAGTVPEARERSEKLWRAPTHATTHTTT